MAKTKIQKTADSKKITALKIFGGVLFIALQSQILWDKGLRI